MARTRLILLFLIAAGAVAAVGIVRSAPEGDTSQAEGSPADLVEGCKDRIEATLDPPDQKDTVIGPVAFTELPDAYRYVRRHRGEPLKAVAILRAGADVRLVVPRSQRAWLKVGYGARRGRTRLQACRHRASRQAREKECGWAPFRACTRGPTLFSGGFAVAFDRAPHDGECAELIVRVRGSGRPLRKYLFDPRPRVCDKP
jgi:hypothetical protein